MCTGISSRMNIPTPCALKASFQIFGWGMRTQFGARTPRVRPITHEDKNKNLNRINRFKDIFATEIRGMVSFYHLRLKKPNKNSALVGITKNSFKCGAGSQSNKNQTAEAVWEHLVVSLMQSSI